MSNAIQHSHSAPANKAGRSFSRFVRTSVKPVVFKLSRKLSVTYWPGRRRSISAVLLAMLSGFVPGLVHAGPTGGQVVAGSAAVLKPTSSTTQINQASQNAIINWQSFSIGAGEAVRFAQPSASAVALNRVIGSDPSRIFGSLTANGKVFLVNSAGVYFAPGASVDVGGMVASSLNISNASFMSGKYRFDAGANAGAVVNDGRLRGAFVVLAAPQVSNAGSIVTTGGATALAAGGRVSLDIAGDKLVSMSVDAATANAAVSNSGSISAAGGKVFMTASSANAVLDTVINTSGIVRAGSIVERNGQIVIDGGAAGTVQVSGTLAASGAAAGSAGGTVRVLGERIALQGGANIDVSGDTGGGSALVGGDLHGAGGVKTAAFTEVAKGAVINADALASGDGGKVVVWADQHTGFRGAISARGGAAGGDGGFVETSGKKTLAFAGKVNTTAARGATGTLLLDPTNITISNAVTSGGMTGPGGTFSDGTVANSNLAVADLTAALAVNNVVVDTASSQAGAGNITVSDAVSYGSAHSLTLKALADINVIAAITNTGVGAINLHGDGAISSGVLATGGGVEIKGSTGGSSNAGSVNGGSIAANGNVVVRSSGPVATGAINAGSGTISVLSNGNVAVNGALATSDSGAAAIVVNAGANGTAGSASGGDVTVSGSVTVGAGGRATLYTGSIAGSTGVTAAAVAGSGNFRYNSNPSTTNFSAALGTGVKVVYREQPVLTIGASSASITYGDATPAFTPSYSGLQNGDTSAQALFTGPTVAVAATNSGSGHTVAGTHAVAPSGAVEQLGYAITYANGSLTVAQKALAASGIAAAGRAYDGTTGATVDASAATIASGGATAGDGKSYTGDAVGANTAAVTGAFADKDAGVGKAVTISGLALTGTDAANYTVGASASATISPKALTAAATATDKVYDGNTTAAPSLSISAGLVGAETLVVSGTGTFNSKDVLTANQVTVDSVALANGAGGGLAANYTLGTGQTATAHITAKALTAAVSAPDKVYDGNTTAAPSLSISGGLVGGESLVVSGSATFNSKDVLAASLVTVNTVALNDGAGGGLASNYSLASGQTSTAHITPKALTAVAGAGDRTYDGTTTATPTLTITSGLVGAETLVASGTGDFNSKDVLTANLVTVQTAALADATGLASNYSLAAGQTATAHITPKALTASVSAPDKVYDGNVAAAPTLTITGGLVGGETLGLSGSADFNSKDVLAANTVTVQSVALADGAGLASNYSLATGQTATAHITPKLLVASFVSSDKAYDGTVGANAVMSIDPAGLVGTEIVSATGIGAFNTKNVLTANQVTVSSVALADGANGGLGSNYSAGAGQTGVAHITPKVLTASASAPDKDYDGNTSAAPTLTITGLASSETLGVSGTGTFNSKDVLAANTVTVQSVALADGTGLASNYSLATGQTATAHITPKLLVASFVSSDKAYDGTVGANAVMSIDPAGLVGTEIVSATGIGAFNTKNVLTANQVTVSSVALADGANGGLGSNYSAGAGQTGVAHITPKVLTASASAPDKDYDGNTSAAPTLTITGLASSETLGVSGTGTFNSKDVLTANQVTVDSVALADGTNGGLASNYDLAAGQTATAHITPKALTASVSALDKVYDGNTAAAPTLSITGGLVGAETLVATGTGNFNSKDVLTANTVTVQTAALADGAGGGLASNYSLATGQAATAHITPKALTASVTASDKVYDGNTTAAPSLSISAGLVGGESLVVSGSATFNSKDVLAANQVTVDTVALNDGAGGGLASNYSLASGQTTAAQITAKALVASALASTKVYDGNASASTLMHIDSGLVGAEQVTGTGTGDFNSPHVSTASQVQVNSVVLADGANGGLASNYSLAAGQIGTGAITPRALSASVAAPDKVYDGSNIATPTLSITAGLVGAETVGVSGSAAFNSKDVLTANLVTVGSVALANGANGGLASDYSLVTGQTTTAHITPKALTASASAPNKVYDGNTAAAPALSITAGLVGTETLGVSGSATFNSKDVLAANLVTVVSVALANGTGLTSNYSLAAGQIATAHITPKALTASVTAPGKVYDGNTTAAPSLSISGGLVGGESLVVSGSARFNSKDVLAANQVTVDTVALNDGAGGGLASNYSLASGQTTAAQITAKALVASALASTKVYDGNASASTLMHIDSGLVGAEQVTGTGAGVFNSPHVSTASQVQVNSVALADGANGGLASNYSLAAGQIGTGAITPKALSASVAAPDKVYDGSNIATPTLSITAGLVGAETVGVSGSAAFNSKDVLTANLVTVGSVALANGANGGLASDYSLVTGQTTAAHITPKALTASASAPNKVYDGNTVAAPALSITVGLVGTETLGLSASGTFDSKNVLTVAANGVTVDSVALANGTGLASNYSLAAGQRVAAHITPKALTASVAPTTKVYNGNVAAGTVMNIDAAGLVGTEKVTGTATGVFNTKDVNSANQVTVNTTLLADGANGGLASNYSLASGQVGAATITRLASVNWIGAAGGNGNWSDPANWAGGAIPDLDNVANVVIPTGAAVSFNSGVPALNGSVQLNGVSGGGALTVSNGALKVANALNVGSYAQAAGQVNAGSLKAAGSFNQTGGKLAVAGLLDIAQTSGAASLGDITAAGVTVAGGGVNQVAGSALAVSDTLTLAIGSNDVTLNNTGNDFNKVVVQSARNVALKDLTGLSVGGSVGGNLVASAQGLVGQAGSLSVTGSTTIDTTGAVKLDDAANALHGPVKLTTSGDAALASSTGLTIGGDVGGTLALTSGGPVLQGADVLHVTGTSSVDAGSNAITLTAPGNHFGNTLTFTGGAVSLVDSGALALGQGTAGTLAVKAGGALTQNGKLAVSGTTGIDATGQRVTLNDIANVFGGKVTVGALLATVNTGGALDLNATVLQTLSVTAADLKVASAEALNLHLKSATTDVNAAKALSIDGAVNGPLTATAGGAVTQTAALTVSGASAINAAGQAVTLADAGNDFGGALSLKAANTQVVDKNALALGASTVSGTFKASAKGDVTQTGALAVTGTTAIDTTGALQLANAGNDFVGAVGVTASTVTLADQNVLTLAKVTTGSADLSAVSELQVAPGGLIDAPNILLSLSPDKNLAKSIGTATNSFAVKDGASVTLGVTTPAVPAYLGGNGIKLAVLNPAAELDYRRETKDLFLGGIKIFNAATLSITSTINSQVGHILVAAEKKADSNAELIERGLVSEDLRVPVPYPHSGAVKALGPRCEDAKPEDGCK